MMIYHYENKKTGEKIDVKASDSVELISKMFDVGNPEDWILKEVSIEEVI